jgi:hypothetical protein
MAVRSPAIGAFLAASLAAGCISGRVLSGYPGYPFASFSIPEPVDSAFFHMQTVLEEEGYPIDYTDREAGLINTRPGPNPAKPVLLSVVLGEDPAWEGRTDVWIAGFEETGSGVRRINPLDDVLWPDLMDVSGRISARFGGTAPAGPDERAETEDLE